MMLPLAEPFYSAGLNVLLYDTRNHGKSDSDSFSSLPRFSEDLDAAISWIKLKHPEHKLIVLGHSIGAAAAILSASKRSDIDSVIAIEGAQHDSIEYFHEHVDMLVGFIHDTTAEI